MQTFENHAYRPVQTVLGGLCLVTALVAFALRWFGVGGRASFALGLFALCVSVGILLSISRVYTTRLQDRIIRLEMRVRAASLLTTEQQRLLNQLNIKQIAALRFASDAEMAALLERAVREKMPAKEIKRAVKSWTEDQDRT